HGSDPAPITAAASRRSGRCSAGEFSTKVTLNEDQRYALQSRILKGAFRKTTMRNCDLSRILEIRDCVTKRGQAGHFFEHFDSSFSSGSLKAKHFLHIEAEIAGIDALAWSQLKEQVVPLFVRKHPTRGWQAAFDKLNQAKGYQYLAKLGYV